MHMLPQLTQFIQSPEAAPTLSSLKAWMAQHAPGRQVPPAPVQPLLPAMGSGALDFSLQGAGDLGLGSAGAAGGNSSAANVQALLLSMSKGLGLGHFGGQGKGSFALASLGSGQLPGTDGATPLVPLQEVLQNKEAPLGLTSSVAAAHAQEPAACVGNVRLRDLTGGQVRRLYMHHTIPEVMEEVVSTMHTLRTAVQAAGDVKAEVKAEDVKPESEAPGGRHAAAAADGGALLKRQQQGTVSHVRVHIKVKEPVKLPSTGVEVIMLDLSDDEQHGETELQGSVRVLLEVVEGQAHTEAKQEGAVDGDEEEEEEEELMHITPLAPFGLLAKHALSCMAMFGAVAPKAKPGKGSKQEQGKPLSGTADTSAAQDAAAGPSGLDGSFKPGDFIDKAFQPLGLSSKLRQVPFMGLGLNGKVPNPSMMSNAEVEVALANEAAAWMLSVLHGMQQLGPKSKARLLERLVDGRLSGLGGAAPMGASHPGAPVPTWLSPSDAKVPGAIGLTASLGPAPSRGRGGFRGGRGAGRGGGRGAGRSSLHGAQPEDSSDSSSMGKVLAAAEAAAAGDGYESSDAGEDEHRKKGKRRAASVDGHGGEGGGISRKPRKAALANPYIHQPAGFRRTREDAGDEGSDEGGDERGVPKKAKLAQQHHQHGLPPKFPQPAFKGLPMATNMVAIPGGARKLLQGLPPISHSTMLAREEAVLEAQRVAAAAGPAMAAVPQAIAVRPMPPPLSATPVVVQVSPLPAAQQQALAQQQQHAQQQAAQHHAQAQQQLHGSPPQQQQQQPQQQRQQMGAAASSVMGPPAGAQGAAQEPARPRIINNTAQYLQSMTQGNVTAGSPPIMPSNNNMTINQPTPYGVYQQQQQQQQPQVMLTTTLAPPELQSLCMVKDPLDGHWYRARVLQHAGERACGVERREAENTTVHVHGMGDRW